MNILASFTHPYVVPNLYDFFLILNTKEEFWTTKQQGKK